MEHIKKIMVCLDDTPMDNDLIRYAAFLNEQFAPENFIFVHIIPEDEDYDFSVRTSDHDFKIQEEFAHQIQLKVATHFPNDNKKNRCIVRRGFVIQQLLLISQQYDIELIIAGKKEEVQGSGILAQRLVRRAACPVLYIPQNVKLSLQKVWVGTDFSPIAAKTLDFVFSCITENHKPLIIAHHIYNLPTGYSSIVLHAEDLVEKIENLVEKNYQNFVAEYGFGKGDLQFISTYGKGKKPAKQLIISAEEQQADMLVVGSRGKTAISAFFLGSITEKIILEECAIPLLVYKDKAQTESILESILNF